MKAGWIVALALGLAAPAASQERSYEDDQSRQAVVLAGEGLMFIGQCERHYDRASVDKFLRDALGNKPLSELTETEEQMRRHFAALYFEGRLFPPERLDEDQCVRVIDSWLKEAKEKGLVP